MCSLVSDSGDVKHETSMFSEDITSLDDWDKSSLGNWDKTLMSIGVIWELSKS